jgi:hypothetical protein
MIVRNEESDNFLARAYRFNLPRIRRRKDHRCRGCHVHPAKYMRNGRVKWNRQHDLCFRCYRSIRDQRRAFRLFNH